MQKQVYKCPNHGLNLNSMRLNNKWCDVIIRVEGREYPAHKNVLAANLMHFEAMFKNDSFQESYNGVATMKNMRATDLEVLIFYAYTGEITLTDANALGLLEVADYLGEDKIKDVCIDFLEKHLKTEDALRAYRFTAVTGCLSLKNKAKAMIIKNFERYLETRDYLDLDHEHLKDIFSGEDAKAIEAQQVFDGIMRWTMHDIINRKNHMIELLLSVDLRKLPADYLLNYLCKNIMDLGDEHGITKSVMFWYYTCCTNDQGNQQNRQLLMIINRIQCTDFTLQFFDFAKKEWSQLQKISTTSENDPVSYRTNVAVVDNKLYYINGNAETMNLEVIDPITEQMETLYSSRSIPRWSNVCSCNRFVYLCGGENSDDSISDQVLRYEPSTNLIERLPSIRNRRIDAAAVFYEGYLHVLGGSDGLSYLNSVERYDPERKKWISMPSMCHPRAMHAVAVLEGKLYACGGLETNSVEVYEPLENRWKQIANLNKSRFQFVLVAQGGKLWAVGGDSEYPLEVYDPSIDQWKIDPEMSIGLEISHPIGGLISRNCIGRE